MPSPYFPHAQASVAAGLQIPQFEMHFTSDPYILAADIDKLGAQFHSWKTPLIRSLDEVIVPSIISNFQAEGRPPWQRLKEATIADRLRKGFQPGPILRRTNRLYTFATRKNIWTVTTLADAKGAEALSLRSNYLKQAVPYAEFIQAGTIRMVARPFMQLAGLEEERIQEIFAEYLDEQVAKYWGSRG